MIFLSKTGSLSYIKIHINRDILRVRLSAQPKSPSKILTRIFTAVRDGLQKYCDLLRSGVNQMWILKIERTSGNLKSLGTF